MMKKNISFIFFAVVGVLGVIFLNSCKSTDRKTGYELQAEIWEPRDSTDKPIYLTGTKPIDSVDVNKLKFDIFRIETKEYPQKLSVYARIYDLKGNFVTNMADPYKKFPEQKYFTSIKEKLGQHYKVRTENIKDFKVREFGAQDSIPYNISLTVDYSGSMDAVMPAIYSGTELFVNMKFPYDKIAISSFNRKYDQKVPWEQDQNKIISLYRTRKERAYGQFSAVYDALVRNMKIFEDTQNDIPRVIVIFTDGDDNYSKTKIGALIEKAKAMNINIFTVAFGYCKDDNLKQIAEYTGGKFYKAYTQEELVSIFRDIYMSLRFYYEITYKPPTYWGLHHIYAGLNIPNMKDSLIAEGEYDTSDMFKDDSSEFTMPVLFEFDSASLKQESFAIIDQIVDQMLARPRLRFEIQGHSDNIGTREYNMVLSEKRAKAVYEAIIVRGIDSKRLRYRGFGFSMPVASNDTPEGRALNRRTVFKILAK